MNFRWMWLGHIRGMAQRWTRTLLSVVAVGAGVSLLIGVVIAQHSLNKSLGDYANRLTGAAALRVEGPGDHGSLDESVLPKVAATPGVKAAVPMIITIVQAADSRGRELLVPALGVDCAVQAFVGSFKCDPAAFALLGDAPVLAPALRDKLGPKGELRTDLATFPTGDSFTVKELNRINHGQVAVFSLPASQRQFVRPGGLDTILVVPEKGTDVDALRTRLAAAVGDHNKVLRGDEAIEGSVVADLILPFLFIISLIGLVIGAQLVRNTLDLSLEERRRDLATTAALGATPRTMLIGLLIEGAVVGIVGGALAVVGGGFIARAFVGGLSNELAKATGLTIGVSTPGSAAVLSLLVAAIISVLASIGPARRAARLDLVSELSGRRPFDAERTGSNRTLAIIGVLALATLVLGWLGQSGGAVEPWQPIATFVALVGSAIVGYVACVQLAPRLLSALQRAPGFGTGPARVALANIVSARRRTVAVAIAITAPVFVSTIFGGIVPGIKEAAKDFAQTNSGRVSVSTLELNNTSGIDSRLTPALAEKLAAFPGVAAVEEEHFFSIRHPDIMLSVNAMEGPPPEFRVYQGVSSREAFARGEVMIGPALARTKGLRPGDTVKVPGKFGFGEYTVGGVWSSPESLGYSVTMTAAQLEALAGERVPGSVLLLPKPGTSAGELAAAIRAANLDPRLKVYAPDELADESAESFASIAAPFKALQYAMLIVALVATASTLALAAAQRRRDNAVLAAIGMSPRDLAGSTLVETVITAVTVTVIGAICAQLCLLNFTWASVLVTGLAIPYRISISTVAAAAAVTTAIALVGAVFPAWRTARTNVMEALRTA
ncbi:MAG: putative transport system permease protein [Actinomycetota bacterium]